MKTTVLETERLILRLFKMGDANDVFEGWESDPDVAKKYWGKGYTTEAVKEILKFAKEELEIKEMIGGHAKENSASENVMRKLGFQYEKDIPYECNNGKVIREGKLHRLYL